MKSYDFLAVVVDCDVLCVGCLPDDVSVNDEDVHPIFADSEWDSYPVCSECGREHDYVSLTTYGQNQRDISQAIQEHREGEFDGLVVDDLSEVPEDYDGAVLHINDHGNATLYSCDCGELKEVASCV